MRKVMTITVDTTNLSWEEEDQLRLEMEVQAEDRNVTLSTQFTKEGICDGCDDIMCSGC